MRIIDKHTDFYDYLQYVYHDNSLSFDRRNSFVLSKKTIFDYLRTMYCTAQTKIGRHFFLKLQVCNTIWLFLGTVTKEDRYNILDYSLELLANWKNYNLPRKLIDLELIEFPFFVLRSIISKSTSQEEKTKDLIQSVNNQNYNVYVNLSTCIFQKGDDSLIERDIPILISCGIAEIIDPLSMYQALEEYFSLEKQDKERTESIGLTNNEKIENHGFDLKTSFRK